MSINPNIADRFWSKVDKSGDCWEWMACKQPNGYGQFTLNGKMVGAHRVAYKLEVGEIPDGLQIDHLCRNRGCVNPSHLEAVTQAENIRRGNTGRHQSVKTHCPQGHPYDEANTHFRSNGHRACRACMRERMRRKRKCKSCDGTGLVTIPVSPTETDVTPCPYCGGTGKEINGTD